MKPKKCSKDGCTNLTNGNLCKPCDLLRRKGDPNRSRFYYTEKKYGVDESGFEALWLAFHGKCGICGIDLVMPLKQQGQPLNVVAIDHDHRTGNLRGLLCNGCNKALGLLKDDLHIMKAAVKYLEFSNA